MAIHGSSMVAGQAQGSAVKSIHGHPWIVYGRRAQGAAVKSIHGHPWIVYGRRAQGAAVK